MFHIFNWKIQKISDLIFLTNDFFWIQIEYNWQQQSWTFFLHPVIDDNQKTIKYYAFDNIYNKLLFIKISKIKWIWQKTAFAVSWLWQDKLTEIIEKFDLKALENLPWIGSKTAKRLIIELKSSITKQELQKVDWQKKIYNKIVKVLTPMWYDKNKIEKLLKNYNWQLDEDNFQDIIIRIMKNY